MFTWSTKNTALYKSVSHQKQLNRFPVLTCSFVRSLVGFFYFSYPRLCMPTPVININLENINAASNVFYWIYFLFHLILVNQTVADGIKWSTGSTGRLEFTFIEISTLYYTTGYSYFTQGLFTQLSNLHTYVVW